MNVRVFTTDPQKFAEKYDTLFSVRAPVGAQNMANKNVVLVEVLPHFVTRVIHHFILIPIIN